MAELKEDKLIVKKENMVKKGAKDGWELIKMIVFAWHILM